ncbi:hypothetical protein XENTR_v10020115 [Xenopus tropicalis]|nr:hypothetical protein XENTR_v10020115 [Xenopus tropicalis]
MELSLLNFDKSATSYLDHFAVTVSILLFCHCNKYYLWHVCRVQAQYTVLASEFSVSVIYYTTHTTL